MSELIVYVIDFGILLYSLTLVYGLCKKRVYMTSRWFYYEENKCKYWWAVFCYISMLGILVFARLSLFS